MNFFDNSFDNSSEDVPRNHELKFFSFQLTLIILNLYLYQIINIYRFNINKILV